MDLQINEIFEVLNSRKKEIKKLLGIDSFEGIKPAIILKSIIPEIEMLSLRYSKKEQLQLVNSVLELNINYNTYYKFYLNYIQNRREKENVMNELKKNKESISENLGQSSEIVVENKNDESISEKNDEIKHIMAKMKSAIDAKK